MSRIDFKTLDQETKNLYSLLGTLARNIDWQKYGMQTVTARRRGATIHMRHAKQVIFLEFEGFGDLFGQAVALVRDYHNITQGFIGINNNVTLCYPGCLPERGIKLAFIPAECPVE